MKNVTVAAISAVAGGIVGGVITYATVNKKLVRRYEDWANEQITEVKARYAQLNSDNKQTFLEMAANPPQEVLDAVEKGKKLMQELGYKDDGKDSPHESARTLSIFDQGVEVDENGEPVDNSDEDEEEDDHDGYERLDGQPYLISEEEYFENEPEYQLDTLTYYEMDDTLCDENNEMIDRVDETVGARHLHMFKKNGTLKTSLYIRNDDHDTLYEVILVEQSYAATILGMEEEELGLKEPKRRPKKMRDDD